MSVDIATLGIRVDSKDARKAGDDLDRLTRAGSNTERQIKRTSGAFDEFKRALAAVGIAVSIGQIIRMADTWKNVQGRLSLVTQGQAQLASVTRELFAIAQRTRNEFEATADLYGNLARTTTSLGASQGQLLQVTETISQALIVSGANAASSEAALRQLGQAFASGALRGDELNSIMENTPRIARAIADGMGKTVGELRALGREGRLTGSAIFEALLSQKDALEREFANMPVTVGQSLTVLKNSFMQYIGETDGMLGATTALSGAIIALSNSLGVVIPLVVSLGTALAIGMVTNMIAARIAAGGLGTALLSAFGGPVGIAITAVTLGITYLIGKAAEAEAALRRVTTSAADSAVSLEMARERAQQAGVSLDTLNAISVEVSLAHDNMSRAANSASGQVQNLGTQSNSTSDFLNNLNRWMHHAADGADRLANSARQAAIAAAQLRLAQARQDLVTLRDERAGFTPTPLGALRGGAHPRERVAVVDAGIHNAETTITNTEEEIRVMQATPPGAFRPPQLRTTTPPSSNRGSRGSGSRGSGNTEAQQAIDAAKQAADALQREREEMGLNVEELRMLQAQRAAALAPTKALREEILRQAEAWRVSYRAQQENEEFDRGVEEQRQRVQSATQALRERVNAIEEERRVIGMSAREREMHNAELFLEAQRAAMATEEWERYARVIREAAEMRGNFAEQLEAQNLVVRRMTDMRDSVREATQAFRGLFGTAGDGFANLLDVIVEFNVKREELLQRHMRNEDEYNRGQRTRAEYEYELMRIQQESAQAQIANFANMLGAAKTFFKEGTTGWKVLEAAERAYRIIQMAMALKAMLFDNVSTAKSVANSGIRAAADGVAAFAKTLASLPFPLNLAAGAAVLAALIAVGVKIAGGGKKGSSASSSASAAVDSYTGPRDEYGMPTSSYSVLKPGAVTTGANDNKPSPNGAGMGKASFGLSITNGDINLTVNGGASKDTVEELRAVLEDHRQQTIEDARQAVAQDNAERNNRQRIGGAG